MLDGGPVSGTGGVNERWREVAATNNSEQVGQARVADYARDNRYSCGARWVPAKQADADEPSEASLLVVDDQQGGKEGVHKNGHRGQCEYPERAHRILEAQAGNELD